MNESCVSREIAMRVIAARQPIKIKRPIAQWRSYTERNLICSAGNGAVETSQKCRFQHKTHHFSRVRVFLHFYRSTRRRFLAFDFTLSTSRGMHSVFDPLLFDFLSSIYGTHTLGCLRSSVHFVWNLMLDTHRKVLELKLHTRLPKFSRN